MAQVTMVLDPKTGERTLTVDGVTGTSCEEITEAIMRSNEVLKHEYTSEYCESQDLPDYINQGE